MLREPLVRVVTLFGLRFVRSSLQTHPARVAHSPRPDGFDAWESFDKRLASEPPGLHSK